MSDDDFLFVLLKVKRSGIDFRFIADADNVRLTNVCVVIIIFCRRWSRLARCNRDCLI